MPGVYRGNSLTRLGLDKLVVDEQTPGLPVFATIGRRELDEEVRHVVCCTIVFPKWQVACSMYSGS